MEPHDAAGSRWERAGGVHLHAAGVGGAGRVGDPSECSTRRGSWRGARPFLSLPCSRGSKVCHVVAPHRSGPGAGFRLDCGNDAPLTPPHYLQGAREARAGYPTSISPPVPSPPRSPPLPPLQGAREALAGYPTSIAQDLELLRGATLAKGGVEETALLVRRGKGEGEVEVEGEGGNATRSPREALTRQPCW